MRLRHVYVLLITVVAVIIVIGLRESPDSTGTAETGTAAGGVETPAETTPGSGSTAGAAATNPAAVPAGLSESPGVAAPPAASLSDEEIKQELERGREFRKQGRFNTAITIFRRGLEHDHLPEDASAEFLFEIGQTYYQSADKEIEGGTSPERAEPVVLQALATFRSVIETYPKSMRAASASYMSGAAHLLLEKPEKALEIFQSTFDRYPDYVARSRALLRAGMVLVVLDRIPEGVATFERVVREFPHRAGDVQSAKKYLGQLEIVGQRAAPLRARTWLNGLVDDAGLSSFEGDVVVLIFLATWCSSCSEAVPRIRRLIQKWSERGVVFLAALNPKDPMNSSVSTSVEEYAAKSGLEFLDVALVEDQRPWDAYRTDRLPAAVVIDRRGVVRWRGHPQLFPDLLVTRALAGK